MKQTAVEWLEEEMLKPNLSIKDILKKAKEIEKTFFYAEKSNKNIKKLLKTLKDNSIDNKVTIENVDLFVKSWTKEIEKEQISYSEKEVELMLYNCCESLEEDKRRFFNTDLVVESIIKQFKKQKL